MSDWDVFRKLSEVFPGAASGGRDVSPAESLNIPAEAAAERPLIVNVTQNISVAGEMSAREAELRARELAQSILQVI